VRTGENGSEIPPRALMKGRIDRNAAWALRRAESYVSVFSLVRYDTVVREGVITGTTPSSVNTIR